MNRHQLDTAEERLAWTIPQMNLEEVRHAIAECDPATRPALLRRQEELEGRS